MTLYDGAKVKVVCIGQKDGTSKKFVPEKHGKWRMVQMTLMADYFECSNCETVVRMNFISDFKIPPVTYNYCPTCGARMDGE